MKRPWHLAAAVCLAACLAAPADAETIQPVWQQGLSNVAGKSFTAVTVDFAPGERALPHRH